MVQDRYLLLLISDMQSRFIERRKISDEIIIANESIRHVKSKQKKSTVLKMDFEKVFDSVVRNTFP